MKNNNRFRVTLGFLAGVVFTVAVMFGFLGGQDAQADQYTCIRTDLNAKQMTGNIPAPQFTIIYQVPSCIAENGYHAAKVYMYGSDVAVTYTK